MWSFFRRLRCKSRPVPSLQIILYTRHGCHLCETARQQLEEARQHQPFALTAVDVDSDPEVLVLYGEQVPVVSVNGKVRFRGGVNAVLLQRLLRAEA